MLLVLFKNKICHFTDVEDLPEEFLLALGKEGEEKLDVGDPIRPELALRWSRIMCDGLEKEAREAICNKYPTPNNFKNAIAPILNAEIAASLSEVTQKRDSKIINRQKMIGKLMTCLGKSLTNILKGNINSKILVEEINDAAKIAADVYHDDSSLRKSYALAGASKVVREAIKSTKTDEFLFGKDCAEKIKSAQTIEKTGAQIKAPEKTQNKSFPKPIAKKQGNWKRPPQHQQNQYQRNRSGQQPSYQYKKQVPVNHPPRRTQKPPLPRSRYHR